MHPPTYDRNAYEESSPASEPDEKAFQMLEDLFEHRAGSARASCRDTIDSILSKYEAVSEEVQQDPRIGLVLSVGLSNPTPRSFIDHVRNVPSEYSSYEGLKTPSEGRESQCDGETQQTNSMITYQAVDDGIECRMDTSGILLDDRRGLSINEPVLVDCGFHAYDQDDSDATWEEETMLETNAEPDEEFPQPKVEELPSVDAKPTAGTGGYC
ncbi:uncharacterized protein EKO05_0010671 [Ascochyta rabiei]|uniref:uncharacterized protein n=1 Tax=Didymella rabiei TaxID=5454 RepID=UPI00220F88C0|nr:uncharacterized protein EKO05_0010671 [Ascochyta rabiei]UPX20440.1 hypothetical protein EKO05_0010671 [Ascochyta rabiei]